MKKAKMDAKASKKAKAIKTLKAAGSIVIAAGLVAGTIGYFVQKDKAADLGNKLAGVEAALSSSQNVTASQEIQIEQLSKEVKDLGLELVNITSVKDLADEEIQELKAVIAEMQAEADAVAAAEEAKVFVGYDKEFGLGDSIDLELSDNQLEKLADYEVEVDGKDVAVKEYLKVSGAFDREEAVKLSFDEESIEYTIEYDNETGAVISADDPLKIKLLGKDVEIIGVEDGQLTLKTVSEKFVKEGESYSGVEVLKIAEDSILVKVGDETEVLAADSESKVGDLEVAVGAIFYVEGADDNLVSIKAGEELEKVYKLSGDDKYYDAEEVWKFSVIEPGKIVITNAEEFEAVDEVILPGEFAKISYELASVDYVDVKVEKEDGEITKVYFELEDYDSSYAEYDGSAWIAEDDEESIDFASGVALKDSDFLLKLQPNQVVKIIDESGAELTKVKASQVKIDGSDDFDNDLDFVSVDGVVVKPTQDFVDDEDESLVVKVPEETVEATVLVE